MAEQLTDTALRALIAQWIKAALGELVEDDSVEDEQTLQSFCGIVEEEVTPRCQPAPGLRGKEKSYAYPCSGGRAAPGIPVAPRPAGRAPLRRSGARRSYWS